MSSKLIAEALDWRYAAKQYDKTKQISAEDLASLKNAIRKAPSSMGLQPFKVLEIKTPELRAKLREASFNQPQVTDASAFFVFCAKKSMSEKEVDAHLEEIATLRKIPVSDLAAFKKSIMGALGMFAGEKFVAWAHQQAHIALGFLLETAAILHIDASPMGGFDPEKYGQILDLKDYAATVVCAVGYRNSEDHFQKLLKHRRQEKDLFETR